MLLHPTPPPHPHPTKPLRALSKNENLRGVQAKLLYVKNFTGSPVTPPPENFGIFVWQVQKVTLPETNGKFAPENRPKPNRKRESIPTIHFQGLCYVSFREGILLKKAHNSRGCLVRLQSTSSGCQRTN